MSIRRLIIVCTTLLLLLPLTTLAESKQHFLLILVPDFSFHEIEAVMEYDRNNFKSSALAAMNIRPDGNFSYLNSAVSLSSGRKGVGVLNWNSFERGESFADERVETLIERWTGSSPKEGLIHPLFHKLKEKNEQTTYKAHVGLLGEELKRNGVFRYVIGHSDKGDEKIRYGSLFTIDENGESLGDIQSFMQKNDVAPYGYEMNDEKIFTKLNEIAESNERSFVVIEWGDLARLYAQKEFMTDEQFQVQYERTLKKLVEFVDNVVDNKRHAIMLLSPMVNRKAYQEKRQLAPLLYWDPNSKANRSELYSKTTRQHRIVSNLDIAPTILNYFHINKPKEMTGSPLQWQSTNNEDRVNTLLQELELIFKIYSTRGVVLSSYISLLVLLLIGSTIFLWKKRLGILWITVGKVIILSGMTSPLWFLLLSHSLKYVGASGYILILSALSLLSGMLFEKFEKHPLVVINVLLFMIISVDLILGSPLMQRSYLGYDPVIGARFYGIGNEYAGVYITSALFIMLPLFQYRWKGYIAIFSIFALLLIFLALPMLGTNAGATLSAAIALIFLIYILFLKERSKWIKFCIFFVLGAMSLYFLYVVQKFGTTSHIGHAMIRLLEGDFVYISDLIKRKLAMNWKVFKYSNWTQLFVTTYILIGILLWHYKDKFSSEGQKLILQTGIIASVALLLLNDSGVVAAATSMFLLVSASYYWLLEKR